LIVDIFGVSCINQEDLDMSSKILPVYGRAIDRGVILVVKENIPCKEPLQDISAFSPSHCTFIAL
jgi:hypothetical protein